MKPELIACCALTLGLFAVSAVGKDETDMSSDASGNGPKEPVVVSDYQPPGSEAQIVIRPGDGKEVFYEYRVNGELVEIKVVPDVGPAYYLVPADGGGWIRETETDLLVPSWVLFRW
jgi:uncharacterized protein DUF2782